MILRVEQQCVRHEALHCAGLQADSGRYHRDVENNLNQSEGKEAVYFKCRNEYVITLRRDGSLVY